MNIILNFKNFVSENLEVSSTDRPGVISGKNYLNDMSRYIKEYNSKKTTLQNIYTKYTDDKELLALLKSNGFIDKTEDNIRKIKFLNPLFAVFYQACEKMRQIQNVSKEIEKIKQSKSEKEKMEETDTLTSAKPEGVKSDSDQLNDSLKDKTKELNFLQTEIKKIQELVKVKEKQIEDEIKSATKIIKNDIKLSAIQK